MQNKQSLGKEQEIKITTSLTHFFKRFEINKNLNESNIKKIRGISVSKILMSIIQLPFIHKNMYQGIVKNKSIDYNKTAAYDFLNNGKYNWRRFLYKVVTAVINQFISPLTDSCREDVLILDDTGYPRERSKKVELLSKVYDHAKNKFFKGFRILQMCWSDGNSVIPLDFTLLSSAKKENRYQEMNDRIDKRSCGGRRRKESVSKSTSLIEPMLKRAMSFGIKARYLLMDSWFGLPAIILTARKYIDVICMVKDTPKVFYYVSGNTLTLSKIYKGFRKKRGNANIKGSQIVELVDNGKRQSVKIVFVKNRNKRRCWLAILSTDISLEDSDIVRIYGKRWDIEVFFKAAKHCLNLCNEVELRSYDGMVAHISIVLLRFVFLSVEQRMSADGKTYGGMFLELVYEMNDITIIEAMVRILGLAFLKIRKCFHDAATIINEILNTVIGLVLEKYGFKVNMAFC